MAKGQFLGVATCAFALIGGTLMTGTAATAAPVDTTVSSSAFGNVLAASAPTARTLPSKAEVAAAKKDPAALKAMVSTIEGLIGDSSQDLTDAEASAANDQDAYETTSQTLARRNAAADSARTEASKATKYYESVKKQVGQLASDLYRNGGVNPGITALVNDSEDNDVLYKASTMNTLATNRSNTLTTAQQAASLWADWQNYADAAETAATDAADANETALQAAEQTRAAYADRVTEQKKLRGELIGQLAYLRDTKRAAEAKRIAALEDAQREERLQTKLAAAPTEPPAQKPAEEPETLAAAPVAVPEETPATTSLAPTSQPKAKDSTQTTVAAVAAAPRSSATTPKPAAAPSPEPATTAPQPAAASTPEPATTTPKPAAASTPEPARTESATARDQAQKAARAEARAAEKAAAEQERAQASARQQAKAAAAEKAQARAAAAEKARAAAAAQKAREAAEARRKAQEAAEARKKAQEQAESRPAASSSSKESAIAWALSTAADDSNYYVYGANGPNAWDCSSFTQKAFSKSGISLPRTSSQQARGGGTKVPLSQLQRGDLVFSTSNGGASFYHVAIYLGGGQVVHARNPSVGISTTALSWVNNIYSYGMRY